MNISFIIYFITRGRCKSASPRFHCRRAKQNRFDTDARSSLDSLDNYKCSKKVYNKDLLRNILVTNLYYCIFAYY